MAVPPHEPTVAVVSPDETRTRRLGALIGEHARPGTAIALQGDLGSGKTVLVQGLAAGLNVPETFRVTSPTYTLIHVYPGRIPLIHADFYRLTAPVDPEDLGMDDLPGEEGVTAIEWPERLVPDPTWDRLTIEFQMIDEKQRRIRLAAHGRLAAGVLSAVEHALKELKWV